MSQVNNNEDTIDLKELVGKIWVRRWFVIKAALIGLLFSIIVIFSLPREYVTTVTLAPEVGNLMSNELSSLASLSGVSANSRNTELSPRLYPVIVHSTPFVLDLLELPVVDRDYNSYPRLYDYIVQNQRAPWWNKVFGLPFKLISAMSAKEEPIGSASEGINPFMLSEYEFAMIQNMINRLEVDLDAMTGIAKISVRMQDPLVTAIVTDSVLQNLQSYVTEYRTNKSREDLKFAQQFYEETREEYIKAQQKYAAFVDRNHNIIQQSHRSEEERLRNEMNLSFNVYNQTAQNLHHAKAKVQEITPVFTVIEPVTVPVKAAYPRKLRTAFIYTFLGGFIGCAWVVLAPDQIPRIRRKRKKPRASLKVRI